MSTPDVADKLVHCFEFNLSDYKSGRYKEKHFRVDFVNPLFKALGWDVTTSAAMPKPVRTLYTKRRSG